MNERNLQYDETREVYVDKYNGVNYTKIDEKYVPLVAGGLPAQIEEHNGVKYLVNNMGTYEIENGRASFRPLKSTLDGSSLFFNEDGKLYSRYSNCEYEILNGNVVALYDTENNLPAHIEINENGENVLVSEQGSYRITDDGTVMTPTEERISKIKQIEAEFLSDPERAELFLDSTPEERKKMMDDFKKQHGIGEVEDELEQESEEIENEQLEQMGDTLEPNVEGQSGMETQEQDGIAEIEELSQDVRGPKVEEVVTDIQQGVMEQEMLQNQVIQNQQIEQMQI